MKKKIIVGAIASIGLSTLLMAQNGYSEYDDGMTKQEVYQKKDSSCKKKHKGGMDYAMMKKNSHKWNKKMRNCKHSCMHKKKGMRNIHKNMMMSTLFKLNLSKTQKQEIVKLLKKYKSKNRYKMNYNKVLEAYGQDNFNKEKYIKIMLSMQENKIKTKANIIEDIFKILNKQQREDFITLTKARYIMMR